MKEIIRESLLVIALLVVDCFPSQFTFGENSTAIFNFGVVLDPLSESAQKWSSLLLWLLNIPGVSVDLRISPNNYREVGFNTLIQFDDAYSSRSRLNASIGITSDRPRCTTTMGKHIRQYFLAVP